MAQSGVQLTSTDENKSLSQQQEIRIGIPSAYPRKPCPDLLNGSRKDYMKIVIPLYEASIRGDWKAAEEILDKKPELVRYSITGNNETALHVAASAKSTKQVEEFVKNLMTKMEKSDLELKDNSSNTALCSASAAGNLKVIDIMVKRNHGLVSITGSQNMLPLYMAALFGHYEVVSYLYEHSQKLHDDCWTDQNRAWLLEKCVETDMFDIALKIVEDREELTRSGSVLGVLAKKTDVFAETESNIIMSTIEWEEDDKPVADKEDQALRLLKQISENTVKDAKEHKNVEYAKYRYPSRILFVAAEMGNTRFIIELIRLYPDLIWKLNDDKVSIFHIAARHRHVDIYNLVYKIGSLKNLITPLKDDDDNNMLHIVARSVARKQLENVSGGAFQMQRELLWFKEVEQLIPRSYREQKNKYGQTPGELFTKEHQDLVVKGEEWMKGTASQCIVVAALIATIVFAAAFTVPGGYDQNDGIPFFQRNISFLIFVVADAISLFSSSASILTFLSILTSSYAENDFLVSLPRKLMLGLATLYLSITTMMIAFSITFFVLYTKDLKWIPIVITVIATMPVVLFAALQYRLLRDVIHSTYGSSYLFGSKQNLLYRESSKSTRRWFLSKIPFISRCTSKLSKLL